VIIQFRPYLSRRAHKPKRATVGGTNRYGLGADRRITLFTMMSRERDGQPTGVLELVMSRHEAIRIVNSLVHELEEHDAAGCSCPRPQHEDLDQTPERLTS